MQSACKQKMGLNLPEQTMLILFVKIFFGPNCYGTILFLAIFLKFFLTKFFFTNFFSWANFFFRAASFWTNNLFRPAFFWTNTFCTKIFLDQRYFLGLFQNQNCFEKKFPLKFCLPIFFLFD